VFGFFTFLDKNYLNKLVDDVAICCQGIARDLNTEAKINLFKKFLKNRYRVDKNKSVRLDVMRREIEDDLNDYFQKGKVPTVVSFIYMIITREKYGLHVVQETAEVVERRLKHHQIDW
jgi:hypothetical protein